MKFSALDWLVFIAVPAVAWLLVILIRNRANNLGSYRGYFLAQGMLGSGTVAATYIGANLTFTSIFLILSQEAFHRGWVVLSIPIFWLFGTVIFLKVYPRIKPHIVAGRTLHQTLGHVYASVEIQRLAAIWTIIAFVGTVALEFYGGILLIQWTGIPLLTSIVIALGLAFAVSAFTVVGGMRGVGVADIFLDVVTFGAAAIILANVFPGIFTGTPSATAIGPNEFSGTDHAIFVVSMGILFIPFQLCTLDTWQRLLAWKRRDKSPSGWMGTGGVIIALAFTVPILVGVLVKRLGLDTGAFDQPLEAALRWMSLPAGVLGLCFAGLAGAMLSTADELLNCCSLSLLADYAGVPFATERPQEEERRLAATGKFYTGVFGLAAAALALMALRFGRSISELAIAVFSAQVVFSWPLLAGLFTPHVAPSLKIFARWSMISGGLVAVAFVMLGWILDQPTVSDGAPVAAFVVSGLTFFPFWILKTRKSRSPEVVQ